MLPSSENLSADSIADGEGRSTSSHSILQRATEVSLSMVLLESYSYLFIGYQDDQQSLNNPHPFVIPNLMRIFSR